MTELPYRTNTSSITNSELILLDTLFSCRCEFRLLRDSVFKPQWNLPYSHDLTDAQLHTTLNSLCKRQFLSSTIEDRSELYAMTPLGGEVWSSERRPDWSRFCTERYSTTMKDRTMMTVVAISAEIRDDFLSYWPMHKARRRITVISDFGLVPWRSFGKLHVGVATYNEQRNWTPAEYPVYAEQDQQHREALIANRSWWRSVGELQQFLDHGA